MATVDPAKAAARRKAQRANAKAMKGKGSNPISGMASKAAKTIATRNGPKVSETAHLSTQQFSASSGGRHAAPSNATSVRKNNTGDIAGKASGSHTRYSESGGKHRVNLPASVGPRLHEKEYMHDLKGAVKAHQGTGYVGKRRKSGA